MPSLLYHLLTSCAALAAAHTLMHEVYIDGKTPGKEVGIRQPTRQQSNSPVTNFASDDMECNAGGQRPVADFIRVRADQTVTLRWWHNSAGDDIIDKSHASPMTLYATPTDNSGAIVRSVGWSKVLQVGWTQARGWPTDQLIAAKGYFSFRWPASIPPGRMLLRAEIGALHEGDAVKRIAGNRGVQVYPVCIQFDVQGGGAAAAAAAGAGRASAPAGLQRRQLPGGGGSAVAGWPRGIRIPQDLKDTDPGYNYNMYKSKDHSDYRPPGPPISRQLRIDAVSFGQTLSRARENEDAINQDKPAQPDLTTQASDQGGAGGGDQGGAGGGNNGGGNNGGSNNGGQQSAGNIGNAELLRQGGNGNGNDAALMRQMRQMLCTGA